MMAMRAFIASPTVAGLVGEGDHLRAVSDQMVAVEGRLDHAALAEVARAFVGQEAFAEQGFGALEDAAFGEQATAGDEDFADQFRFVDVVDVLVAGLEVGEGAVVGLHPFEISERIAAKADEAAGEEAGGGSGRPEEGSHRGVRGAG
jgi:hypothetical protein